MMTWLCNPSLSVWTPWFSLLGFHLFSFPGLVAFSQYSWRLQVKYLCLAMDFLWISSLFHCCSLVVLLRVTASFICLLSCSKRSHHPFFLFSCPFASHPLLFTLSLDIWLIQRVCCWWRSLWEFAFVLNIMHTRLLEEPSSRLVILYGIQCRLVLDLSVKTIWGV